jgi:hypothetical protein
MQAKKEGEREREKEKLNSNKEGGERRPSRARKQIEYNTFADRNELLDNEALGFLFFLLFL